MAAWVDSWDSNLDEFQKFQEMVESLGDTLEGVDYDKFVEIQELFAEAKNKIEDDAKLAQTELMKEIIDDAVIATLKKWMKIHSDQELKMFMTALESVNPEKAKSINHVTLLAISRTVRNEDKDFTLALKDGKVLIYEPNGDEFNNILTGEILDGGKVDDAMFGRNNLSKDDNEFSANFEAKKVDEKEKEKVVSEEVEAEDVAEQEPDLEKMRETQKWLLNWGVKIDGPQDYKHFVQVLQQVNPGFPDMSGWYRDFVSKLANQQGNQEFSMAYDSTKKEVYFFEPTDRSEEWYHARTIKVKEDGTIIEKVKNLSINPIWNDKKLTQEDVDAWAILNAQQPVGQLDSKLWTKTDDELLPEVVATPVIVDSAEAQEISPMEKIALKILSEVDLEGIREDNFDVRVEDWKIQLKYDGYDIAYITIAKPENDGLISDASLMKAWLNKQVANFTEEYLQDEEVPATEEESIMYSDSMIDTHIKTAQMREVEAIQEEENPADLSAEEIQKIKSVFERQLTSENKIVVRAALWIDPNLDFSELNNAALLKEATLTYQKRFPEEFIANDGQVDWLAGGQVFGHIDKTYNPDSGTIA